MIYFAILMKELLEQATDIFTKILLEHNCNDKIEHILL